MHPPSADVPRTCPRTIALARPRHNRASQTAPPPSLPATLGAQECIGFAIRVVRLPILVRLFLVLLVLIPSSGAGSKA